MKRYRLKKEAVNFFKEDIAPKVLTLDEWDSLQVDHRALEEVKPLFVTYGFKQGNGSSLSGWSNPESNDVGGSHFHFTIHFPSVTFRQHDEFNKGRVVRELMEKIQSQLNYFYEQYEFKN